VPVKPTGPDRFELQQHADGQVYISKNGEQMLHAQIRNRREVEIQIGADGVVEIDKMYGPMVFWSLRVSCDLATCEWVIERLMGPLGEWREWTRIPGQLEADFLEAE
jgi:hypothetical protein